MRENCVSLLLVILGYQLFYAGMKTVRLELLAVLFAAFTLIHNLHAQPSVTIETVAVGDAGNAADTTGKGAVANVFAVGKYEVTISQYTAFLNSVAAVTSDSFIVDLWDPGMAADLNIGGSISRSGNGTLASPYSYSVIGSGSRPIAYVSWLDAARFANWLNNGATGGASTENGAYALNGSTNAVVARSPEAQWWIPSEDEWYKAAYYKGGSTNAGYWQYPTRTDTPTIPEANPPGTSNSANFANVRPNGESKLTDVGSYLDSISGYGTFDQGGNLWEWTDTEDPWNAGRLRTRGGGFSASSFPNIAAPLSSDPGPSTQPVDGDIVFVGFRVATVPEPSTYALLAMSAAGTLWWARRRR
jgi:sulfatase modifying factor 1